MSATKLGRNPFDKSSPAPKAAAPVKEASKKRKAPRAGAARLKNKSGRATRGLCPLGGQAVRWAAEAVSVGVKGMLLAREAVIVAFSR